MAGVRCDRCEELREPGQLEERVPRAGRRRRTRKLPLRCFGQQSRSGRQASGTSPSSLLFFSGPSSASSSSSPSCAFARSTLMAGLSWRVGERQVGHRVVQRARRRSVLRDQVPTPRSGTVLAYSLTRFVPIDSAKDATNVDQAFFMAAKLAISRIPEEPPYVLSYHLLHTTSSCHHAHCFVWFSGSTFPTSRGSTRTTSPSRRVAAAAKPPQRGRLLCKHAAYPAHASFILFPFSSLVLLVRHQRKKSLASHTNKSLLRTHPSLRPMGLACCPFQPRNAFATLVLCACVSGEKWREGSRFGNSK
jgi:hypothetical protein